MSNHWYELKQLCTPKQWKMLPISYLTQQGYPVYGANGVIGYYSTYTHEKETILVTCRGSTCGQLNICEPFSYITGNAMALDNLNEEKVHVKYLYYYLKYRGFHDIISGSAQPQITQKNIEKIKIFVPNKLKQMKIIKLLDKNSEISKKRFAQKEKLNRLIKSLFIDKFGEPKLNPKQWPIMKLMEVSNLITYGITSRPKYVQQGVPVISSKEIRTGEIHFNEAFKISYEDFQLITKKNKPKKNEILLSKTGLIGNCTLVRTNRPFVLTQNVARINVKTNMIHPEWLLHYFRTEYIYQYVNYLAKGNAVLDLQIKDLKQVPIYVPPMEMQLDFIEQIKKLELVKNKIEQNIMQLQSQYNAICKKVFPTN